MSGNRSLGEVLERLQAGDQAAATEVYRMYHERLVRLAQRRIGPRLRRHVQAESVMLSVLEAALAGLAEEKLAAPASGSLWNLLERMTENKIRKKWEYFTAGKRDVRREVHAEGSDPLAEPGPRQPTPEEQAALADQLQKLRGRLKEADLEVFEGLVEGYSYAEIARRLGCSRHQVRYRAKRVEQVAGNLSRDRAG